MHEFEQMIRSEICVFELFYNINNMLQDKGGVS